MNYDELQKELALVKTKIARAELLKEQAEAKCKAIEEKYNISSVEELQALYDEAVKERDTQMELAVAHLAQVKAELQDV